MGDATDAGGGGVVTGHHGRCREMEMENAKGVQEESFAVRFECEWDLPPMLVVVGEHDIEMAKRDFEELKELVKKGNSSSEGNSLQGA